MAVRRTFKQKQKTKLKVTQGLYQLPLATQQQLAAQPSATILPRSTPTLSEIFGYEPQLLLQDVIKTLVTTVVIVAILMALTFSGKLG